MFRKVFSLFIFIMFMNPNSYAADLSKIGIVDFKEFMSSSVAGKAIQEKIKQNGEELKSELDKAQIRIKEFQKRYKKEAPLFNKEQKEEKQKQFQIRLADFRRLKEIKEKEFNEFRAKLINELKEDIIDYAKKMAKEEGYLLIIEKQSGTILYVHRSINITDELIQDHNKFGSKK